MEDFIGLQMHLDPLKQHFELRRMLPPGEVKFFFMVNGELKFSMQENYERANLFFKEVRFGETLYSNIKVEFINYIVVH